MKKELITVYCWKSLLLSYFEDMNNLEYSEKMRCEAQMGVFLIPKFIHDLGCNTLKINRVDFYNWNIDWDMFRKYMRKNHPYLELDIWRNKQ